LAQIPSFARVIDDSAAPSFRVAVRHRRGERMSRLERTTTTADTSAVRYGVGNRVCVPSGVQRKAAPRPDDFGDEESQAESEKLQGVVVAVDDEGQRALVRVVDSKLGVEALVWYRFMALSPIAASLRSEPSWLQTTVAHVVAAHELAERRIGDAAQSSVLHALLAHWPEDRPLSQLVDDDAQWVALLTLIAARFLRQEEAPERAGEREPVYKRLLSVELTRLLRQENQRLSGADATQELAAGLGSSAASLDAALRRHAPLGCRLMDDCIAQQFWTMSSAAPPSGGESAAPSPSFGLATWILSLVATASVQVGAHYVSRVLDSLIALAAQPSMRAFANQRTQMFTLLAHFVAACAPLDGGARCVAPDAAVRAKVRSLVASLFTSDSIRRNEKCAIAELALVLHQRDWLLSGPDAPAGELSSQARDFLKSMSALDDMLALVCQRAVPAAGLRAIAEAVSDMIVDTEQCDFRPMAEQVVGRQRVAAPAGTSACLFRVLVTTGETALSEARQGGFNSAQARLYEPGASEPFAVVRSIVSMGFISVPFAEFEIELCDAAAADAALRFTWVVAQATSRDMVARLVELLPSVAADAALVADAAHLVDADPAIRVGGDDADVGVRVPTLALQSDSARAAQAHLYRAAAEASRLRVCVASALVRRLRQLVLGSAPRINFERHAFATSLCARILRVRSLLEGRTVRALVSRLQAAANIDMTSGTRPTLLLDRIGARTQANSVPTVFEQLASLLLAKQPSELRQEGARAFRVELRGEGVTDAGGGYREILDTVCIELQTQPPKSGEPLLDDTPRNPGGAVPLLLPCPNAQLAAEAIGVGQNRDKFVLNPSAKSPEHLRLFRALGRVMGIALASNSPVPLDLPPLVWKALVGDEPTVKDLVAVDQFCGQSLDGMRQAEANGVTRDNFSEIFFETFTTTLSDGSEVELVAGGAQTTVTFENRLQYAALVEQVRLNESAAQLEAVRTGLVDILGDVLWCFTWSELEQRVCGSPVVDVARWRQMTEAPHGEPTVEMFWQVVQELTNAERQQLLRFISGRSRLGQAERYAIQLVNRSDQMLPTAATCFLKLSLPCYSSAAVMKQRLLLAIQQCTAIDMDFVART
jgi:hypothetical protein